MNRSRSRFHTFLAGVVFITALTTETQGGFSLPPDLQDAGEEVQNHYLQVEGARALREKIAVGKQRYEERLAFRQQLITGLKATAYESRSRVHGGVRRPTPVVAEPDPAFTTSTFLWMLLTLFGGWLLFRLARHHLAPVELPSEEEPEPAS